MFHCVETFLFLPTVSEFPEKAKNCILEKLNLQRPPSDPDSTPNGAISSVMVNSDAGVFSSYYKKTTDLHSYKVGTSSDNEIFWVIPFIFDSVAFATLAIDKMTRMGHSNFEMLDTFLSNISFYGFTGKIEFQNYRRIGGDLSLYNVEIHNGQVYKISLIDDFSSFSNIKSSGLLPEEVSLSSIIGVCFMIIFSIIFFVSIATIIYLFYWKSSPILQASSYLWHFLLLLSFILYSIGCLIWELPKSSHTCTLKVCLIVFAFFLLFACLAYKCLTFFTIKHGIYSKFTNFLILVILVFFFFINLLLFYVGMLVEGGGHLSAVIMQSTYDPYYFFYACVYVRPSLSGDAQYKVTPGNIPCYNNPINIILFAINFIFIFGLSGISLEVKDLNVPYEESKYLSFSIILLFCCFFLFSSFYWSFAEIYYYYQKRFLIRSIISVIAISGIYGLLIVPKLMYIRQLNTINSMERVSVFRGILSSLNQSIYVSL